MVGNNVEYYRQQYHRTRYDIVNLHYNTVIFLVT